MLPDSGIYIKEKKISNVGEMLLVNTVYNHALGINGGFSFLEDINDG